MRFGTILSFWLLLSVVPVPTFAALSEVSFVDSAEQALATRWSLIDNEKEEVLADFNMWESNGVAGLALAKLCLKARSGVRVRLAIDGYSAVFWGVGGVDSALVKVASESCQFQGASNLVIRYWNPVNIEHVYDYLESRLLKRDHDKILFLKSQATVYSGDRNWQNVNYRQGLRDDQKGYSYISIDAVVRGPVVDDVHAYLEKVWAAAADVHPRLENLNDRRRGRPRKFDEYTASRYSEAFGDFQTLLKELAENPHPPSIPALIAPQHSFSSEIKFVHFDPAKRLSESETADDQSFNEQLKSLITSAQKALIIVTPYLRLPRFAF